MEGILYISVLLDESADFGFEKAVCDFVSQDDLSHMNVLLVEGIVEFDALQLAGSLLPQFDELISVLYVTDFVCEIFVLFLSQILVVVVMASGVV